MALWPVIFYSLDGINVVVLILSRLLVSLDFVLIWQTQFLNPAGVDTLWFSKKNIKKQTIYSEYLDINQEEEGVLSTKYSY